MVAHLIDEGHFYVFVVGVYFAAALVAHHKYRFDTRGGLGHQAGGARWGDGQQGDVAAAIALHIGIQGWVDGGQALDERVLFFALAVVNRESSTVAGHVYRGAVSIDGQTLVDFYRHLNAFIAAVTEAQCGQGISFGGDAYTRAATSDAGGADFVPQFVFYFFQVPRFRVFFDFFDDAVHFFQLHVDDVVHETLGELGVFGEFFEIEEGFRRKRVLYIAV